jgi:L-arabinose isomerase
MKATRPRIGLLALTLELYETLAPKLRSGRERWVRREVLPALRPRATVRFGGAVFTADDVSAAVNSFEANDCDAILVMCLSYAPSLIALPALRRTTLPIIVWNTQELHGVTDEFGRAEMMANHGVHGTQDLCSVLVRSDVPFEYVTSHLGDVGSVADLRCLFKAAEAVSALRRARVGLLGYPFPGMGDFAVSSTHLAATLGAQVVALSLEDYITRAARASNASVRTLVETYRDVYSVDPEVTAHELEATARAELALRRMVKEYALDALSYQFMAFGEDERSETMPFVAACRLMAEGVGFGGEGDVVGALGTWLLNRLAPPTTFSEMFTVDYEGNTVFMSHMGEVNVAMARNDQPIRIVARPTPITRTRQRQLALVPEMQFGPATLCALVQGPACRWRFVVSAVTLEPFTPRPELMVPQFALMPDGSDVRAWLTRYAKAGGPHHNAVCQGDARPLLKAVATLLDADYCEV